MLDVHVTFTGNFKPDALLKSAGLEEYGRVQMAIDKAVIDYMMPYWAWETGTLAKSAYGATRIGSGEIVYPGPYAHYMYMGEVYGPNIPIFEDDSGVPTRYFSPPVKHPTGRSIQYSKDVNPLAGPFPLERMRADHIDDILEEARKVARNQ